MKKTDNLRLSLLQRSLSLSKVLFFGIAGLRLSFFVLLILWGAAYTFSGYSNSFSARELVMSLPSFLQMILVFIVGTRTAFLLMNPQLHLMGMRKEIYISLLVLCVAFSAVAHDPRGYENFYTEKIIAFNYLSVILMFTLWINSLQIVSIIILGVVISTGLYLTSVFEINIALSALGASMWSYFAFWMWRSPLQRQFKFESFAGLTDYCVERLKIIRLKYVLNNVRNKEHVILMAEGDGYLNRLLLAPIFSFVFTLLYNFALHDLRELCLWMILSLLGGTKAKLKVTQSHAKLWLLNAGDRAGQFATAENISLRLNLYPFFTAAILLVIWIKLNPDRLLQAVASLCICLLFVVAADYCAGFIAHASKIPIILLVSSKMVFMFAMVYMQLPLLTYMFIAIVLLMAGIFFRERAKRNFLVANLSVRAP